MSITNPAGPGQLRDPIDEHMSVDTSSNNAGVPPSIPVNLSLIPKAPFPKVRDEFELDDRVAFSKAENKWILEDEEGEEWEWNEQAEKWIRTIAEEDLAQQQQAYVVEGVEEEIADPRSKRQELKKRKQEGCEDGDGSAKKQSGAKRSRNQTEGAKLKKPSTAVYITNLPADVTVSDLQEAFQKYGFIAESETGEPRIKIYTNPEDGSPKGDGLVVYVYPQSVQLAIQMMDEAELVYSGLKPGKAGPIIRVTEADTTFKKVKADDEDEDGSTKGEGEGQAAGAAAGGGGGKNPAQSRPKAQLTAEQKQRLEAQRKKVESKLADWGDEDYIVPEKPKSSSSVVLSHMFTLDEIEADPAAMLEIKEDIWDECGKLGNVTKLVLYDGEPDGIVLVRFGEPGGFVAAERCVKLMSGRAFDGRVVKAEIWDGKKKFKKAKRAGGGGGDGDDDEEEQHRLDKFGDWLEGE